MNRIGRLLGTLIIASLALTGCGKSEVDVPNVVGMSLTEARESLAESGFETGFYEGAPADGDSAVVRGQVPIGGKSFRKGASVYLSFDGSIGASSTASSGPPSSGVAQTACDGVGESRYPYGWNAHWLVGLIADRVESGARFLKAEVTVKNEYGVEAKQTVECTVGGTNDAPDVTSFLVY